MEKTAFLNLKLRYLHPPKCFKSSYLYASYQVWHRLSLKNNIILYILYNLYWYIYRFALKCAFGESYNDLYPGTIYSPPSYDVRFSSTATSSWYHLFTFIGFLYYGNINTLVWDIDYFSYCILLKSRNYHE